MLQEMDNRPSTTFFENFYNSNRTHCVQKGCPALELGTTFRRNAATSSCDKWCKASCHWPPLPHALMALPGFSAFDLRISECLWTKNVPLFQTINDVGYVGTSLKKEVAKNGWNLLNLLQFKLADSPDAIGNDICLVRSRHGCWRPNSTATFWWKSTFPPFRSKKHITKFDHITHS